jgi:energy-coupling factor transporter ATP-binding protein EcfA2
MYISKINLQNIKDITSLAISIPRNEERKGTFTFLQGAHGSGKTTILKMIAATCASGSALAGLIYPGQFCDFVREGAADNIGVTQVEINRTKEDLGFKRSWPKTFNIGVEWHTKGKCRRILDEDVPVEVASAFWDPSYASPEPGWMLAAYGMSRFNARSSVDAQKSYKNTSRSCAITSLLSEGAALDTGHYWAINGFFKSSWQQRPHYKEDEFPIQAIKDILGDGLIMMSPYNVGMRISSQYGVFQEFFVETSDKVLSFDHLGTVKKAVFSLVLDILFLIEQFSPGYIKKEAAKWKPLEKPILPYAGVVLIDDFDVYLSSSEVVHLATWLRYHFPAMQFIATSTNPTTPLYWTTQTIKL